MSAVLILVAAGAVLCSSPSVYYGDSLHCGTERVRIINFDASKLAGLPKFEEHRRSRNTWCDDAAEKAARRTLAGLLTGHRVTIVRTDAYGRTFARVYADDIDVAEWLIERSLARHWRLTKTTWKFSPLFPDQLPHK